MFIHGIPGIGKSSLLELFLARARTCGATVVKLDYRSIEPTERGFIHELGAAIGGDTPTVEESAESLGSLGHRVVLALDTYEVFRLMDSWLRQIFIPALCDNVRVIICGRVPTVSSWLTSTEWEWLFMNVHF